VKALDKQTVEYTLRSPVPYFMTLLSYVCFFPANGAFLAQTSTRFGTDHKTLLNNGAYILKNHEPQNIRELVKNELYWDKDKVYIPKLTYRFNREASTLAPELFFRGEITAASIPTTILDGWLKDAVRKDMVRPAATSFFSFWYAFNFDPKFPAQYEPDNWRVAVQNLSFRKSIFHGLDRVAAMETFDPYNPKRQISNTITPATFSVVGGVDYTNLPALAKINATDSFNKTLAVEFKNKAMTELAGKVTFPVKVMMPFSTADLGWTNRVQVIEQQLENLLGKNFIDVIPVGFPSTGFLDATRRAGNYALQEVNWGPDFADPYTYTNPFWAGNPSRYTDIALANTQYQTLLNTANAELVNTKLRFETFARAEAILIDNALVIPYRVGGGGYVASMLHPFSSSYAPFGVASLKFKLQEVLNKPMNTAEFNIAFAKWQKERAEALKKYAQ
ncbi:MAG: ABC transporter substrate-binding protein, partial [bacterium]|nr:ABC transporter substrate-binding protein [bacterium]